MEHIYKMELNERRLLFDIYFNSNLWNEKGSCFKIREITRDMFEIQ